MEKILLACDCGKKLKTGQGNLGKKVKCPSCRRPIVVCLPEERGPVESVPVDGQATECAPKIQPVDVPRKLETATLEASPSGALRVAEDEAGRPAPKRTSPSDEPKASSNAASSVLAPRNLMLVVLIAALVGAGVATVVGNLLQEDLGPVKQQVARLLESTGDAASRISSLHEHVAQRLDEAEGTLGGLARADDEGRESLKDLSMVLEAAKGSIAIAGEVEAKQDAQLEKLSHRLDEVLLEQELIRGEQLAAKQKESADQAGEKKTDAKKNGEKKKKRSCRSTCRSTFKKCVKKARRNLSRMRTGIRGHSNREWMRAMGAERDCEPKLDLCLKMCP